MQLKKKDNNPEGEAGEQAPGVPEDRSQKTEVRRQKTEVRRQKTEDRRQKSEVRVRRQRAGDRDRDRGRGRQGQRTSDAAWLSRAKVIDTAMKPPCTGSLTRTATRGGIRRIWISIQRRSGSRTTWKAAAMPPQPSNVTAYTSDTFLDYLRKAVNGDGPQTGHP